jgi:hypothetical protein
MGWDHKTTLNNAPQGLLTVINDLTLLYCIELYRHVHNSIFPYLSISLFCGRSSRFTFFSLFLEKGWLTICGGHWPQIGDDACDHMILQILRIALRYYLLVIT